MPKTSDSRKNKTDSSNLIIDDMLKQHRKATGTRPGPKNPAALKKVPASQTRTWVAVEHWLQNVKRGGV